MSDRDALGRVITMRDPFSVEADHGVLGAMFLRPELIDILSADLAVDDFYYQDNAALYRGILTLHAEGKPADAVISARDKFDYDCCLYALLHRELAPAQWDVLVAKYSTYKANKVGAIGRLVSRTTSPAPQLFIYKALAWAIPKLRGVQDRKRSTDMIVLPAEFYDMNTWDLEASPERTRRDWRRLLLSMPQRYSTQKKSLLMPLD